MCNQASTVCVLNYLIDDQIRHFNSRIFAPSLSRKKATKKVCFFCFCPAIICRYFVMYKRYLPSIHTVIYIRITHMLIAQYAQILNLYAHLLSLGICIRTRRISSAASSAQNLCAGWAYCAWYTIGELTNMRMLNIRQVNMRILSVLIEKL